MPSRTSSSGVPAHDLPTGTAFAATFNFRQGVEQYRGEVLFLAGACSTTMGKAQQRRHTPHFRKARLEVITQAGHNLFNDQPHQALQIIRTYLAAAPSR